MVTQVRCSAGHAAGSREQGIEGCIIQQLPALTCQGLHLWQLVGTREVLRVGILGGQHDAYGVNFCETREAEWQGLDRTDLGRWLVDAPWVAHEGIVIEVGDVDLLTVIVLHQCARWAAAFSS